MPAWQPLPIALPLDVLAVVVVIVIVVADAVAVAAVPANVDFARRIICLCITNICILLGCS